jgi:UDP-N-acetylmuramoylalanine--D-glutamate ligase
MLESAGKRVHLGGNIGIPPLEMLKADIGADDWVVIELANFQIIDLKYSPIIAVCLMVVPEHLNWHSDMEEYIKAKQQLFAHQLPKDTAIYLSGNEASVEIASVGQGKKIPYFKAPGALVKDNQIIIDGHTVCRTDEIKLLGQHNWQNVCAAVTAVWQINQNIDAIRSVVISFSGLEHRLEFVREVNGIKFYNDSFAATPDAGTAAIEAIHDPKVMIMGGFDRQLPLERFAKYISEHSTDIRKLLLIGESSERVSHELTRLGFNNYLLSPEKSMDNIVDQARTLAQNGDSVVLSPGFASFDMFKNFEERGQMYKSAVNKL